MSTKKVPLSIASVTFRVRAIVENLGNLLGDQKLLGHFLQVFAKQCYLGHYNSTLANSAVANTDSAIMEIDWLKIGKQNMYSKIKMFKWKYSRPTKPARTSIFEFQNEFSTQCVLAKTYKKIIYDFKVQKVR